VQLAEDKQGDGEAASALDLSWSDAQWQYTVSQRLLNAKNDSRMYACREFYGSTDGRTVIGWDYSGGYAVSSDDSHLWHVHLSILRKYCNDAAALSGIAQVITGGGSQPQPPGGGDWFDMASQTDLENAVRKVLNEGMTAGTTSWASTNKNMASGIQNLWNLCSQIKSEMATKKQADMILFGDGRDVPVGSDTHPWNCKVIRQMCVDILSAVDALEATGTGNGSHTHT
jgi:hypothetical protein